VKVLFRPSKREEIPRLKELWKVCFEDEEAYIDHCFECCYQPERVLVLEVMGRVVSMLMAFPYTMTAGDGSRCPAGYVYAFCTDPKERGKGYGRQLLACAERQLKAQGCQAVVMVPGEESLFQFYEALGYETACTMREETMLRNGNTGGILPCPCPSQIYGQQREKWLSGLCHVSYEVPELEYQRSLCRSSGGRMYLLGDGVATVEVDGDQLVIKELLTAQPEQAAAALMNLLGAERATVRFPVLPGESGVPFGVVKWFDDKMKNIWDKKTGWLAFGFD
jgi:GNAT superfamily N-acetyltransferase